jgi:hypothetical protein
MSLEEIESVVGSSADADEVLRETVRLLADQPAIAWAGIAFVEEAGMVLGPSAGTPDEARRTHVTLEYKGNVVGELRVDGEVDHGLLEAIAERISAHALLGWDTGGEAWEP